MDHYPERLPLAGMPGPGCRVRTQPPAAGEQRAQLRRCAAEVLRPAADEEWLLFSAHDAPPGFARLNRRPRAPASEHRRAGALGAGQGVLRQAAGCGPVGRSPLVDELADIYYNKVSKNYGGRHEYREPVSRVRQTTRIC